MKINIEELKYRQSLSLSDKIDLSSERIESWYDHWKGMVYISFSGGKDSTVLRNIVNSIFVEVPSVFIDTGLEYPEIRSFVKSCDNVVFIKPKMTFKEIIDKYGYPIISKEQSEYIDEFRNTKSEKLRNYRIEGNKSGRGKISKKWLYLKDAPFKISDKCCDFLKKEPIHRYEKETDRRPYLGNLAIESNKRTQDYLRYGCNAFDTSRPISRPLAFWTEKDIMDFIEKYNITYTKDLYSTLGYQRTGCMFCMFGTHMEKEPNKFQRMKETHPKQYEYCMNQLGLAEILDYVGIKKE
jgi:3'-phosphoadenosine 5'-phosphosulfate sulfotransferase (PAPS reductase)/FAD synthetase